MDSEKYHSPGVNPSLNAFVLAESIGMKGNAANVKNKSLSELLRLGGGSGQMRPGFAESACKDASMQRSRGSAWLAKLGKKKPLSRSNMPDRHVLFTVCVRHVRKRRRAMAAVPGKRKTSFQKEYGSESVRVPGIVYVARGKPMAYGRVLPAAARNQCRNFR